ncbi:MAG: 5-deoxy-glucuronate isomerase [Pseudomonadales bacterium]
MSSLLLHHPGFSFGLTSITTIGEADDTGIHFGILKLRVGEEWTVDDGLESAILLLQGKVTLCCSGKQYSAERRSIFDDNPTAIHFDAEGSVMIIAITDCELALSQVTNDVHFGLQFFDAENLLLNEQRGKGLLDNTAYRTVRTLFDKRNRPDANLVLGEVITFPGRWSSYPPHHHPQPEIYHYRFTEPQGFGYGETGDLNNVNKDDSNTMDNKGNQQVVKIHQYDTLKILYELDHAQVAAPGYGMYYIWVIRHLENNPYTVPEFTEEHAWTQTEGANARVWRPLKSAE